MENKKHNDFRRGAKREKPEFDHRVLDIRRVTRVMAGGKRFRFRASVVLGDGKGRVGVGVGKGADTTGAIEKASRDAKKNLITVVIRKGTILHEVIGKFSSAVVLLRPTGEGRGVIAGGPVRVIANLSGVTNLASKILGTTTNKLNNARATIEALKQLKHAVT